MSQRHATLATSSDGETLWFNGALVTIRVPGEWSGGAFSLVEVAMRGGRATGLHSDPSDETMHVLEGELLVHVDGAEQRAGVGDTLAIPRGTPHALLAVTPLTRVLVLNTPGTHDTFFRLGGHPATDLDFAAAPPPDLERTKSAAEQVGVALLGPPPFHHQSTDPNGAP